MRVEIGALVSEPAGDASVARRVTGQALELVARQVAAEFGEGLDLQLGRVTVDAGVSLGGIQPGSEDAAAAALAERIFAAVRPQLSVLRPVSYAAGGPEMRRDGGGKGGVVERMRKLFGLSGGAVEIHHPDDTPEHRQAADDYYALMTGLRDAAYQSGGLSKDALDRAVEATEAQLKRNGVAYARAGTVFTIEPKKQGSQLNVLAYRAKKTLGTELVFDVRERVGPTLDRRSGTVGMPSVGSFSSSTKSLKLDYRSVALGSPAGTLLHEMHHAFLYGRIDKGRESFLNMKMWNLDPNSALSSAEMYQGFMSNQELSTFAKQPRQVLGMHLKNGAEYSESMQDELTTYLYKLEHASRNGKEVPERLMPLLEAFRAGQSPRRADQKEVITFRRDNDGDVSVSFQDYGKGIHHRIQMQDKAKGGVNSAKGQQAIAEDLLRRMRVMQAVSELLILQTRVLERELAKLQSGTLLTPGDQRALKDLLSWTGYTVRVGDAAGLTDEQRLAELARQKALALSRLG